jgi:class 3 adenylate cyclase
VSRAVECAIAVQRRFAEHRADDRPSRVRIGMSAGEPVTEDRDLFGASVNLAARICAHAAPDRILVSSSVRDLAIGKPFQFVDQGAIALRGFDEPIRIYEVGWSD